MLGFGRKRDKCSQLINEFDELMKRVGVEKVDINNYKCVDCVIGKLRVREMLITFFDGGIEKTCNTIPNLVKFLKVLSTVNLPRGVDLSVNIVVRKDKTLGVVYKLYLSGRQAPFLMIGEGLLETLSTGVDAVSTILPSRDMPWFDVLKPLRITCDYPSIGGVDEKVVQRMILEFFKSTYHDNYKRVAMFTLAVMELSRIIGSVVTVEFSNKIVMTRPSKFVLFSSGFGKRGFLEMWESEQKKVLSSVIEAVKRQASY